MKKTATRRGSASESTRPRGLRLGRETIRTLRAEELSGAVGGSCDMTTFPSGNTTRTQKDNTDNQ